MVDEILELEEGVWPGEHTAWSSPNGMRAEVRKGTKVVKRFRGETAWMDAKRTAEDLNLKA